MAIFPPRAAAGLWQIRPEQLSASLNGSAFVIATYHQDTPVGTPMHICLTDQIHITDAMFGQCGFSTSEKNTGRQIFTGNILTKKPKTTLARRRLLCYNVRRRTFGETLKREALLFCFAKAPAFSKQICSIMSAGGHLEKP